MEVNIIYGVKGLSEVARAMIRQRLEEAQCTVLDDSLVREIKSGIDHEVEKYAKPVQLILILSVGLEKNNRFTFDDLLRYQKAVPSIKIVIVVENNYKGTEMLKDMSDNGMYLALYSTDTEPHAICDLIVKGRTVAEAKKYYGVTNSSYIKKQLTIDGAIQHVMQPISNEKEYIERVKWAKEHLPSEDVFIAFIERLPNEVKDVLAGSKPFYPYVESYVIAKSGTGIKPEPKKGLFGFIRGKKNDSDQLNAVHEEINRLAEQQQEEEARILKEREEEARKKAEMERLAKEEADKIMRERAEAEEREKAEREAKAKAEEEAKRKLEEERLKAEEEAKKQAEESKRKAEEEARAKAEEERLKAEEEARIKAEEAKRKEDDEEKKLEAEANEKKLAEEKAKAAEEERLKAEAEAKEKAEEEVRLKAEAEAKAKAEEEARLKAEAEAKEKAEREARAKSETEAKAREEAKRKAEEEKKRKAEEKEQRRKEILEMEEEGRQRRKIIEEQKAKEEAERKERIRIEAEAKARIAKEYELKEAEKRREEEKNAAQNDVMLSPEVAMATSKRMFHGITIGVAGGQRHVGCTHQALLIAHALSGAGFKVAAVEDYSQADKVFESIASEHDKESSDVFTVNGVDYYPCFSMKNLPNLIAKDYNFIVVDFGLYDNDMMEEFGRCVSQILVTGTRYWETEQLPSRIFESVPENLLKRYNFLFLSTPKEKMASIKRDMLPLKNVFFGDYEPNPYSSEGYPALREILSDFLALHENIPAKKNSSNGLFGKFRR